MGQRWDKVRGTTSSVFGVGNARPGNKSFQASCREYSPPEHRWNDAGQFWEFTEDGTHFFPVGTGFCPAVFSDGMADGDFGYLDNATGAVYKTDALVRQKATLTGVHVGVSGRLMVSGVVPHAKFTTSSPTPVLNSAVYLACSSDDAGTAAGKVTSTPPSSGLIVEVGLVVAVDPLTFPTTRVAAVLLRVKGPLALERCGVPLIGSINGVNRVFTTPTPFVHESGGRSARVYYNGQRLFRPDDYEVSESGGSGTGYDTVTLTFAPKNVGGLDRLDADYVES